MSQLILDFLNLKISVKEFLDKIEQDKDLYDELQNLLPTEETLFDEKWKNFPYALTLRTHKYDLKEIIKLRYSNGKTPSGKSGFYEFVYKLMLANGFNVSYNDFYHKRFLFLQDILPEYIGGDEAEAYIDKMIESLPSNASDSQRKKIIKQQIKESFVCETSKKPKWVQEPEWPVSSKPLHFLSQNKQGTMFTYCFKDEKGIIKEIIQYN